MYYVVKHKATDQIVFWCDTYGETLDWRLSLPKDQRDQYRAELVIPERGGDV